HAGEGAADRRHQEGDGDRRPGILRRGDAGQREEPGADDHADAERDEPPGPEMAPEGRPVAALLAAGDALGDEEIHGSPHLVAFPPELTPEASKWRPG